MQHSEHRVARGGRTTPPIRSHKTVARLKEIWHRLAVARNREPAAGPGARPRLARPRPPRNLGYGMTQAADL